MTSIRIPALPHELNCKTQPHAEVHHVEPNTVVLGARAGDDLFADPSGESLVMSASVFGFEATGDFQFRVKVAVDFHAKFDSGVLVGFLSPQKWFKICSELDPMGHPRVVTVVTNGRSDESNGTYLAGDDIHLRMSRTGPTIALHASPDGEKWDLARYFALYDDDDDINGTVYVGIAAQSPAGEGTRVTFSEFDWKSVGLRDPRDGS
jgi:hypothetical protein